MPQALEDPPTAVDPERLEQLIELFHLRWNVPLLASLQANPALGRVVVLAGRLDVGRSTVRRTLGALGECGWTQANSGYGHPLRPEFVLTASGAQLAPWCADFAAVVRRRATLQQLAYQKWPMVVLWAVGNGCSRFGQIEELLPQISPRALSLALKDLHAAGLVRREVIDSSPVRVVYRAERSAQALLKRLRAFFV